MTIRGAAGEREVPADEFFVGVYMTAVAEGELLTRVSLPPRAQGVGDGFAAVTIGAHGTCIANAAATVTPDGVRVALGCVSAVPVRAAGLEEGLAGGDFSEVAVRAAAAGLGATLDPPADVHATADYRRRLAETCAVRAVLQAAAARGAA
jgi:carbon-monoxide dehydrogenase medium subunit